MSANHTTDPVRIKQCYSSKWVKIHYSGLPLINNLLELQNMRKYKNSAGAWMDFDITYLHEQIGDPDNFFKLCE